MAATKPERVFVPGQQRQRPLEVLSLGLPRTGTASMAEALEQLGYDHCSHGFDLMDDPDYVQRWERATDAKYYGKGQPFTRADYDELLGHCGAVADAPCVFFWRELCDAYPDAKVVLVERDEDRWFDSFRKGVIANMYSPSGKFSRLVLEPLLGSRVGPLSMKLLQGFFNAKTEAEMLANARPCYRKHYDDIKATLPSDRVLCFELGSGWQPLCSFLGRDVPDVAFPWVNEADALQAKIEDKKAEMSEKVQKMLLTRVLPAAVVGFAAYLCLNGYALRYR